MKNTKPNPLLPVPTGSHPPPVLNTAAQLDKNLTELFKAVEGSWHDGDFCKPDAVTAYAAVRNALPAIEQWRREWAASDRPANFDLIAAEALKLATTLPQAGNINQQILSDTLCEDIAEMRPTAWVLIRACRAHRTRSEFLSFKKLTDEIRRAEMRAGRFRDFLQQDFVALGRELEAAAKEQLKGRRVDWEVFHEFFKKQR